MEKIQVAKTMIKPRGIFDMGDYYKFLYNLIQSLGYAIGEDDYSQKELPAGKDIEFHWTCIMNVDDYTQFELKIECKVRGLQEVQVVRENIKEKKNKGEVELTVKGNIITDYNDRWEKQPLLKFLKKFYDNYLYRSTWESYYAKLNENVFLIENEAKAFFELPRFM